MSFAELDKMILTNLADIEATAMRLLKIDAKVWTALEAVIEQWALDNGWVGLFDYDKQGLWVAPAEWDEAADERNPGNAFWFTLVAEDPDTHFALSDLCGLGGSRHGVLLHQVEFGKAEWKTIARKNAAKFEAAGFRLDGNAAAFMPVVIDPAKLADDVAAGDFNEAFAPLNAVLERLADSKAMFWKILFPAEPVKAKQ